MVKVPHCKICDKEGHYPYQCWRGKVKRLINRGSRKKPNNIRGYGKYTKKWGETKRAWLEQNKADHYTCYICGKWLSPDEMTLDHVIPRSRAPQLRYTFSNIRPCCWTCNSEKGSKVYA
jgi:5-methylcytosine-specific restriction endonuclease McrA